jgi:hypothetical protein
MLDYVKFNMNQYIKVKIYDIGYQRLADLHNKHIGHILGWEMRNANYYKNRADEDGYTRYQLWQFIEDFGPVTGLVMVDFYNVNILIEVKREREDERE